ncbi:MAG: hypothetical protein AAF821_15555 [Cyanobacteria bacterium P01_D01_bin.156]
MQKGFAADYVIQDDARHYLFWMERFSNADAFPNDVIADYLQSIAPWGYKLLYRLGSYGHLSPDWLAKVLPMVLGLITAGYYYRLALEIFPIPAAGTMASVMLSQHLWCNDGLVSASPRAFIYPLLVPLLFYFVRGKKEKSFVFLGLLVLFYPPVGLVATTLYAADAVDWLALKTQWHRPTISQDRAKVAISALILAALCVIPTYLLTHQSFGPVVTMAQAQTIPEFQPSGRHSFFRDGIDRYWLVIFGGHGAILKRTLFTPVTLVSALFLLPMCRAGQKKFPELSSINPRIHVFTKLIAVSLVWFGLAYAVAFRLHMPGRYTSHCIMVVLPIFAAIVWTCWLKYLWQWKAAATIAIALILALIFFYYPLVLKNFPKTLYIRGKEAPIYEYLQRQPQNTVVASLDYEVDNIPSFAKRSVLMAPEYATPFHLGYYQQIRQRARDLLRTHYTSDLESLKAFTNTHNINFWLVSRAAFSPDYLAHHRYWANNYRPLTKAVVDTMATSKPSLLEMNVKQCSVVETQNFWLLDNSCVLAKTVITAK